MNTALDQTYQIDECAKVWKSFEYFLDEYVWIEDKEKNAPVKLSLWDLQRDVIPDFVNEKFLVLLKTRQVGLTWLTAAYVLWLAIKHPLFLAVVISLNEAHSTEFMDRVYFIQKRLPSWLYPPIKKQTTQNLIFAHTDSESSILSMPTILTGAESKTPNVLIIDEAHTIDKVDKIYNASLPGIEQAKGQVVIIANSVKIGKGWPWVRDLCTAAKQNLNKFKLIFIPWFAHPGRAKTFREDREAEGMDKEDVKQHYPESLEEALESLASSYFGDALGRHTKTVNGIKGRFERDKKTQKVSFVEDAKGIVELWRYPYFMLEHWDKYHWRYRYAAGSDVSEGLGSTFSVGYIIDRKLDEIVCRIRSNRIDAHTWAQQLNMMADYYERALICVESTGAGQTTVKRLEELKASQYVRITSGVVGSGLTSTYGWHESQSSKHELCGDLRRWLKEMTGILYDKLLIEECQTFIQLENGSLDHEEGKLSDCVMGAGCTIQASKSLPKTSKIEHPPTGWLAREIEKREDKAVWGRA